MRLIQLELGSSRAVARVYGEKPQIVPGAKSMLELAQSAIAAKRNLTAEVESRGAGETFDYTAALAEGRVLPPLDHPDATHCWITGTGLTHLGSAEARDKMHVKLEGKDENLTDSLKMFKMGLEGGKPKGAGAGVQPEWFYKGDGSQLVAPGQPLAAPAFALGNEFSDHVTERHNYLWLAHSKLRHAALGPELLLGDLPDSVEGESRIWRDGKLLW